VLGRATAAAPSESVTVDESASPQSALETTFTNRSTQPPVAATDRTVGAVSYRSVARAVERFDDVDVADQSVGLAVETPEYVSRDQDSYDRPGTLAEDDYVLVEPHRPAGHRDTPRRVLLSGGPGATVPAHR
jgi:ABC-type enterochelin transport system substrate-binding protein